MNMKNTSEEKAQQSSILGFDRKGSRRKAFYDRMRKEKTTAGSVDWAYFVKWRRVRIGDIVFHDIAASALQPGEDIPTDATTLLSAALSSIDWFGLSYIMSELGVTEPPRIKEDRVAVAFRILSNRQQLDSVGRNSQFYNGTVPNQVHSAKAKTVSASEFGSASASSVSSKSNTLSKIVTNDEEVLLALANQ
jgi:hypothetical protein